MEKIKYPVADSFPEDAQASVIDLEDQGFRKVAGAVVMRSKSNPEIVYLLLSDPDRGQHWQPVRIEA